MHGRVHRIAAKTNSPPESTVHAMTNSLPVEIERRHRDALRAAVIVDLIDLGELELLIRTGRMTEARAYRVHFARDMQLLDELGWEEQDTRERFELNIAQADLETVMRYFDDSARERMRFLTEDLEQLSSDGPGSTQVEGAVRNRIDLDLNTIAACRVVIDRLHGLDVLEEAAR
jgi:hypothetical protein